MARIGIYGATGYTGYELIKLLVRHPEVELVFATARSDAGKRLSEVFPTMIDQPLVSVEQADLHAVDLIFTCLPHNAPELIPLVQRALDAGKKLIDFSDTFRLNDPDDYARRRGRPIPPRNSSLRQSTAYLSSTARQFDMPNWSPIPAATRSPPFSPSGLSSRLA